MNIFFSETESAVLGLPEISVLTAHLVASFFLIVILFVFVRKPIQRWLARRRLFLLAKQKEIEKNLLQAKKEETEANKILAATNKSIKELLAEAKRTAQFEQEKILADANFEKNNILVNAKNHSRQIEKASLIEARKTIADHTIALTTKLLKKKITMKDHQQIIDEFINTLDDKK